MGTEQDKTNAAVVGTMLALGAAAMIGGSAALVALARGEIHSYSEESQGFANLTAVQELKTAQRGRLDSAKLPIAKAKASVVADLQRDPSLASPALPEPVAPDSSGVVDPAASAAPSDSAAPSGSAPTEGSSSGAVPSSAAPSAAVPAAGSAPVAPSSQPKGTPAPAGTH